MMKELLKINEIATLPKSIWLLNYERYRSWILIAQIEDFKEGCVKNSRLYSRNKPLKNVMVGPDLFILLNDSAIPKMIIEIYFNFFRFFLKGLSCLNVVEATHMVIGRANRNFVRFAHS